MKRVKLFLATLLTVALALFCLAGCSGAEGTYKLSKIVVENGVGTKQVYRVGEEMDGEILTKDFVVLELKENGKFTFETKMSNEGVTEGTWKEKDDDIFLTVNGVTNELDEEDGLWKLEISDSVEIYLKKQ